MYKRAEHSVFVEKGTNVSSGVIVATECCGLARFALTCKWCNYFVLFQDCTSTKSKNLQCLLIIVDIAKVDTQVRGFETR